MINKEPALLRQARPADEYESALMAADGAMKVLLIDEYDGAISGSAMGVD